MHSAVAESVGLEQDERERARDFDASEAKRAAALRFAREVYETGGHPSDATFTELRDYGHGDAEIVEIIAKVGETMFTNYINESVETELDIPVVEARGRG